MMYHNSGKLVYICSVYLLMYAFQTQMLSFDWKRKMDKPINTHHNAPLSTNMTEKNFYYLCLLLKIPTYGIQFFFLKDGAMGYF